MAVALARRRRGCLDAKKNYSRQHAHTLREWSARTKSTQKLALCATGSSMLGEVTAAKCFYQAKVFHPHLCRFRVCTELGVPTSHSESSTNREVRLHPSRERTSNHKVFSGPNGRTLAPQTCYTRGLLSCTCQCFF